MPVSDQQIVFHHVGNGLTITFPFGCQIPQPSDLQVYLNDVLVTSGFDVSGIGVLTGGAVTFDVPPADLVQVRIERVIPLKRTTDYQQNGDFLSRVVNPDFDRIWMALQQHQTMFNRALSTPKSDPAAPALLPPIADRANKLLSFDADGNPIAVAPAAQSATALQMLLAASDGPSLLGWLQAGAGAVLGNLFDRLRDGVVTPQDFMTAAQKADARSGNPQLDHSAAIQAAINTGMAVDLGGRKFVYRLEQTVAYTGKVVLFGSGATVKSDVLSFRFTDGTGSRVHGFTIMPITTPYTIKRNSTTWNNTAADVVQSLEGYMPSGQETDIWAAIPQSAKDVNATIKPGIYFNVSSAAGGSDVEIYGITGRQVNIVLEGYTESSVHDCNIGAGGLTYGGILFFNGLARAYNHAFLGYTLPRGANNSACNNTVKFATLCGIVFYGNDAFNIQGNTSRYHGESAYKLAQYDGIEGPNETTACINTRGRVVDNYSGDCWFDGFDLQVQYGVPYSYIYCGTVVSGNKSWRNRHTGFVMNGSSMVVTGNHANDCGTIGICVIGTGNTVTGNHARNNGTTGTTVIPQVFDILVQGEDCVSVGNNASNPNAPSDWNYVHTGFLGAAPPAGHEGIDANNWCDFGLSRVFVSPNIPAMQGSVTAGGYVSSKKPFTVVANAYAVGASDSAIAFYTSAACTLTLPAAADFPGRVLNLKNTNAFAINSASANITAIIGGPPVSAILAATAGKWCMLQSDGATWQIMAAN